MLHRVFSRCCPEYRRRREDFALNDRLVKLVSGGQTGVDRGALDAALERGFSCGGWCPAERLAEDGPLPDRYPLTELPGGSCADRTEANVRDSEWREAYRAGRLLTLKLLDESQQAT